MWRVANGAMRLGMLDDPALSNSMITIAAHLAFVHATSSPECLTAQAANTGEDVETLIMRLESAYYREHADVRSCFCALSKDSARSSHLWPRTVR